MSVPGYAPGDPSYCQVEALAGNTVMYRQLSFVKYVEPECKKWHFRGDRFFIASSGIYLFYTNFHFPSPIRYTLLVLQFLMLCLQLYCIAKMILAFRREYKNPKGPAYHIIAGPAYTVPLPSANCDLGSDNTVEAHISGQIEKVSFSE